MADRLTFEEEARDSWKPGQPGNITDNQLKVGCLQRIGTALERIAVVLEKIEAKPQEPTIKQAAAHLREYMLRELPRQWGKVSS